MRSFDPDTLAAYNQAYFDATPDAILRWAAATFREQVAVITSFQPTGIVTVHMLKTISPNTPIITIDTGRLFPETYQLIDEVEQRLGVRVRRIQPKLSAAQQDHIFGTDLPQRDPDLCCHLRKVVPLDNVLTEYAAWITGIRRDQASTRAATPVIGWDTRHERVKLAPFARWTEAMIWDYISQHRLPYNPLHDQGYPSIGCEPCTRPVSTEAAHLDPRAGRWVGHDKTECGLHHPE